MLFAIRIADLDYAILLKQQLHFCNPWRYPAPSSSSALAQSLSASPKPFQTRQDQLRSAISVLCKAKTICTLNNVTSSKPVNEISRALLPKAKF